MFERTKSATIWVVLAVVVIDWLICMGPIFPAPIRQAITTLARESGWLISPLLILCMVKMIVLVGGIAILIGGLRPADVGLTRRSILPGLGFFALLFGGVQIAAITVSLWDGNTLTVHPEWANRPTLTLGTLLANVLGVALVEDLIYRGFVFPQLYLKLRQRIRHKGTALVIGLIVSQFLFALGHIPYHYRNGTPAADFPATLGIIWAFGVLFALVYLRSGNLFYAVAFHGLGNAPVAVFQFDGIETGVVLLLVLCWLVLATGLAWLRRRAATRETANAAEPRCALPGMSP